MSETAQKYSEITSLPLFPLPLVLFPGEVLPLHIFEPRYWQMLLDIQMKDRLFGLSFFNQEESDSLLPEPGSIGCIAKVRDVQILPDGRSNILTLGVIRYELENYIDSEMPYLIGNILVFEDYEEDERELNSIADEVFGLFKRIAQAAHDISGNIGNLPDMEQTDPQTLSFLISASFNLETVAKYQLVKTRSTIGRLEKLRSILGDAVLRAEETAQTDKVAKTNGHSKYPPDLSNI